MWSFQVRFSSTIISKNFIDVVLLISKLFVFRIGSFRHKSSLSKDLWKAVARVAVPATTILKFTVPVVFKSQNSKIYR